MGGIVGSVMVRTWGTFRWLLDPFSYETGNETVRRICVI
jgi:hypothetical protein